MTTSGQRKVSHGAVAIFDSKSSDLLGRGSYGKVCKAKCGQLPCAAKLPHDIILDSQDPNIQKFVKQFEQECQFLKIIKHPNVVQFLGTYRDPRSQRLALLMELMDESLTRFLERSTGPLPYHTQLNICQDVALALAYLHSNDIIHRDLTSNNVLLIGEGSRAKVTDFGVSRLLSKNPRMTQLTECPGNSNYMPPEALISPPRYSSKLDCFSHGVLTIQIVTRQFPDPGDANTYVEDPRYPAGRVLVQFLEADRRKKDIDLVASDHPLLPLALHCLKDRDTERPSADELCERLATLKCEPRYTHSVEQSREQNMSLQTLQKQILDKDSQLERAKSNHERELHELQQQLAKAFMEQNMSLQTLQQQILDKDRQLEMARFNHKRELHELYQQLERARQEKGRCCATLQRQLQQKEDELVRTREQYDALKAKETGCQTALQAKQTENKRPHIVKAGPTDPVKLTWRQGTPAPETMISYCGVAVVHGNTAYFSRDYSVYSYSLPEDKWTKLPTCECEYFSLAIVDDKLTCIGGRKDDTVVSNTLLCLSHGFIWSTWVQLLPPMPTARDSSAAVTIPTHLVVAGGKSADNAALSIVEVLDLNTLQWSSASSSPEALWCPHMMLCRRYLYLSEDNATFSCSVKELLKSCKPPSTNSSDGGSVWTKLTDIPIPYRASLATLRGHVLAIGGSEKKYGVNPTGAIHCYDRSTNSWSVVGEMPTPRSCTLVAVLPSNELIVVGGEQQGSFEYCDITDIGSYTV